MPDWKRRARTKLRRSTASLIAALALLLGVSCHSDQSIGPNPGGVGGAPPPQPAAWSFPIQNAILYVTDRYDASGSIFKLDLNTSGRQRLTQVGTSPRCLAVSPAGDAAAYVSSAGLTIESVEGSKTIAVATACPVWSPNGQRLATDTISRNPLGKQSLVVYSRSGALLSVQAPVYQMAALAWSPDSKSILYTACPSSSDPDCRTGFVAIVDADSLDHPRVLGLGFGGGSFSPNGSEVVYNCAGICVVSATGGSPVKVGEGISPEWSPVAPRIAFLCGLSACVSNADGSGLRTLDVRTNSPVHWSPDGKALLFVSAQRNSTLYAIDPDAGHAVNILSERGNVSAPVWMPNSDGAAAARRPPPVLSTSSAALTKNELIYQGISPRLWVADAAAAQARLLFNTDLPEQCGVISPDRHFIAFSSRGLWVAAVDGGSEVQIDDSYDGTYLQGPDECPVWSPDGTQLAWKHRFQNLTAELRVSNVSSRQTQRVDSADGIFFPQWSPDSRGLYYTRQAANPGPGEFARLWFARLGDAPSVVGQADWALATVAPDGRLAVECANMICVSGPNGENAKSIAQGRSPIWAPNGSTIALIQDSLVYLIKPDGTGEQMLGSVGDNAHWLGWSPDGTSLAIEHEANVVIVRTNPPSATVVFPFARLPSWTPARAF